MVVDSKRYRPVYCHIPVIPTLGRLSKEDLKFEASLSYTERLSLKKKVKILFTFKSTKKGLFVWSVELSFLSTRDVCM
jgi:hypothetical protein